MRQLRRGRSFAIVLATWALWLPFDARAQAPRRALAQVPPSGLATVETGRIVGRILDESGAALPGVTLVISGDRLPEPRTITTDATGSFEAALPVGRVAVTCQAPGFVQWRRENVQIAPAQDVKLNVTMKRLLRPEAAVVVRPPVVNLPAPTPPATAAPIEKKPAIEAPAAAEPPPAALPPAGEQLQAEPPVAAPAGESSVPQPPAAHKLLEEIDRYLEQLDPGNIAFNVPEQMGMGDTTVIRLLLSPMMSAEALQEKLRDAPGTILKDVVKIAPRMEAVLTGHNFQVEPITPSLQAVSRSSLTEWRWSVTPKAAGPQELHLVLNVSVEGTSRVVQTFDRTIRVKVTLGQRLSGFAGENWKWLWTVFVVPVGGWLWRRRSSAARKAPEESVAGRR